MARYLKAKCRKSRRLGKDLDFKTRDLESKCKLSQAPGQHGAKRKRDTDYGTQLVAKQALRFKYGLMEKPFRRLYHEASRRKGATGVILLQLLESRLDNLVYRMGLASTRCEARQLVSHRAILVNDSLVNIPSYNVKPGDIISVRERARSQTRIQDALQQSERRGGGIPEWVSIDPKKMSGEFKRIPDREDLPSDINEQLVVEFYSK
jgi:small subunit ribosomal protein S4